MPNSWKTATVTSVYKEKRQKCDPESYRSISLTSVVHKVMESILKDKILEHLQQHHWFRDLQHGFLPGRSTQTAHLAYLPRWYAILDTGLNVDVCYLDFRWGI